MTTGDVEITIVDGGAALVVPGASVQVVIGCAAAGTVGGIVVTQNPNTLASSFTAGELPEAAALSALAGGTIIGLRAATVTPGSIRGAGGAAINITSSTNATPIVVTSTTPHGLITGATVTIVGHLVNTNANGTWKIESLTSTTFRLVNSVGNGIGAATGTIAPQGSNEVGTGTSVITFTGTPVDNYFFKVICVNGGTIGVTGIQIRISGDAGRNYGPPISIGTANTYVITGTGVTINFGAGTLVVNDYATCGTIAPATDTAGIISCLDILQASPYAVAGWGSLHITGAWTGANASTLQIELDSMALDFSFSRLIMSARDASPPVIYGGTGESDQTWLAALQTDYSAVQAKRVCANGGYYNMPSAFPNPVMGTPRFRRQLSYALAARQVTIPPQRHAGRVRDGSLQNIVISPATDPTDGFVYHDERLNPGLDVSRFCSARTRIGLPGYYINNPNLMSQVGSVFTILPLGNVMDNACAIVHQVGQQEINSDIRLNANGTIYENEALAIQSTIYNALFIFMISENQISAATVTVDRTNNILATSTVKVNVVITARGYVLEEDVTIGFTNPFAAGG